MKQTSEDVEGGAPAGAKVKAGSTKKTKKAGSKRKVSKTPDGNEKTKKPAKLKPKRQKR